MNRTKFNEIFLAVVLSILLIGCKAKIKEAVVSINVPGIENFIPDGDPEEWGKIESYRLWADPVGRFPDTSDLEANFKVSWDNESLILMFEVKDESFSYDTLSPWKGDAIEIFLSPFRGSDNILQISVISLEEKNFLRISDWFTDSADVIFSKEIKSFTQRNGDKRITEIRIPFQYNPQWNKSFALQIYVDDSDNDQSEKNQLVWYPAGHSYNSSFPMFTINLSDEKQTILNGSSRLFITDNEKISLLVFGAQERDEVGIYRNGEFLRNYKASGNTTGQPDIYDITSLSWDIENDSLFVTINGLSLSLHELILAPRLYEKTEEKRFDRDIRSFIIKDRQSFPPENATLFIGSSSIVRWQTLKKDFPELQIIQRGFGGSTSPEALMYINQIVLPYKPAKIVYYEGDNDVVMGFSSEEIRDNIKAFIETVIETLPGTRIYIISPKPSIGRMQLWEKYRNTHVLLKNLADGYENVEYVDVATPMFDEKGKLNHLLFVEDGIHMNEAGYAIWTRVLRNAIEFDR